MSTVEHADLFLDLGDRHLFADRSLPTHDDAAATLLIERVVRFLDAIGRSTAASWSTEPNAGTPVAR